MTLPAPSQIALIGDSRYSRGRTESSTYPPPPRHSIAPMTTPVQRSGTKYLASGSRAGRTLAPRGRRRRGLSTGQAHGHQRGDLRLDLGPDVSHDRLVDEWRTESRAVRDVRTSLRDGLPHRSRRADEAVAGECGSPPRGSAVIGSRAPRGARSGSPASPTGRHRYRARSPAGVSTLVSAPTSRATVCATAPLAFSSKNTVVAPTERAVSATFRKRRGDGSCPATGQRPGSAPGRTALPGTRKLRGS